MKLAELLIERTQATKNIAELKRQVLANLKVQEGEQPALDPNLLLQEIKKANDRLAHIIGVINKTNNTEKLDNKLTVAEGIAKRDAINSYRSFIQMVIDNANAREYRSTRSEIKIFSTVNIAELKKQSDTLAKDFRILDTKIQEKNWITEVEL
jgi:hypothetical protein